MISKVPLPWDTAARTVLLFTACLSVRIVLALCVVRNQWPWVLAAGLGATAIAWAVMYAFRLRKTGQEVLDSGGRIWWASMRPVHSLLYAGAALFCIMDIPAAAGAILMLDVLVSVIAFLYIRVL